MVGLQKLQLRHLATVLRRFSESGDGLRGRLPGPGDANQVSLRVGELPGRECPGFSLGARCCRHAARVSYRLMFSERRGAPS